MVKGWWDILLVERYLRSGKGTKCQSLTTFLVKRRLSRLRAIPGRVEPCKLWIGGDAAASEESDGFGLVGGWEEPETGNGREHGVGSERAGRDKVKPKKPEKGDMSGLEGQDDVGYTKWKKPLLLWHRQGVSDEKWKEMKPRWDRAVKKSRDVGARHGWYEQGVLGQEMSELRSRRR